MKTISRIHRARLLRLCSLWILLALLSMALAPSPAWAVPHKESSGPLLGDPDGPDQAPSPGPAKAGTTPIRATAVPGAMARAQGESPIDLRGMWHRVRVFELFTVIRMTLGR